MAVLAFEPFYKNKKHTTEWFKTRKRGKINNTEQNGAETQRQPGDASRRTRNRPRGKPQYGYDHDEQHTWRAPPNPPPKRGTGGNKPPPPKRDQGSG